MTNRFPVGNRGNRAPAHALANVSRRRALLAQIYLTSGGTLTLEETARILRDEHGLQASVPTLSQDLKQLRGEWDSAAGLTTQQWRERLIAEWQAHKQFLLSRGQLHPDYSHDFSVAQHAVAKLTGAYEAQRIKIALDGLEGISSAVMADLAPVTQILSSLNPEQYQRAMDFILTLNAENGNGVVEGREPTIIDDPGQALVLRRTRQEDDE